VWSSSSCLDNGKPISSSVRLLLEQFSQPQISSRAGCLVIQCSKAPWNYYMSQSLLPDLLMFHSLFKRYTSLEQTLVWGMTWSWGEIILLIFVWLPPQPLCCIPTLVTHILTWASALKSPLQPPSPIIELPHLDIKLKSKMADCPKSGIQICNGSNFSRHYPCVPEQGHKIRISPHSCNSAVAFVG